MILLSAMFLVNIIIEGIIAVGATEDLETTSEEASIKGPAATKGAEVTPGDGETATGACAKMIKLVTIIALRFASTFSRDYNDYNYRHKRSYDSRERSHSFSRSFTLSPSLDGKR